MTYDTPCISEMKSGRQRLKVCQVDHQHIKIQEYFNNLMDARLRAKTFNNFGYINEQNISRRVNGVLKPIFNYACTEDNCSFFLSVREVVPKDDRQYGLHGCARHSHSMEIEQKVIEIVFNNLQSAKKFYLTHLEPSYTKDHKASGQNTSYSYFRCIRKGKKEGYVDCKSWFSMKVSFPQMEKTLSIEDKPHSIQGLFSHNHEKEARYQRLSKLVKEVIDQKLSVGVSPQRVYKDLEFPTEETNSNEKPATYPAIYDRSRKLFPEHHLPGESVIDGLRRWLDDDFVVRANVNNFLGMKTETLSETAKEKFIDTKDVFIMMTNDFLLKKFNESPKIMFFDATHKVSTEHVD